MLQVKSLSIHFGKKQIFHDLNFSVKQGEIVGLVGENGAGKSTLLKVLAALCRPSKGTITVHNQSYHKNRKQLWKQIGYVPQDIAIWDSFTVKENMIFFEKLAWKNRTKTELEQLCLDMGLDRWKDLASSLSGGMKRKLNIAISLIHDPKILLLDEPTAGIDLKSKMEIAEYLKKQAKIHDKLIIYTSHDMNEINHLCDYALCIGNDPFYLEILQRSGKNTIKL